ncbi:MAG: hypothetical protein Sylvanvirus17_3 [Sylvanvirus sp.]|uniref:Uncharacterized protein n=1 Tax=Sylvanvirus sp. TaxID=2487774 RepID=A0A3G5AJN0_9VIRU|nr:MAG: hypothetical protein Sylvanvirus17_3 [Sylvanvirus sp.]
MSDPFLIYSDGYGHLGHAINNDYWSGYDSACWNKPFDPTGMPKTLSELLRNSHDGGDSFYASGGVSKWKYVGLTGAAAMNAEYLVIYYEKYPGPFPFAVFRIEDDLAVTLVTCHARGFVGKDKDSKK